MPASASIRPPNFPPPKFPEYKSDTQRRFEEICTLANDGSRVYKYGDTGYNRSIRHFVSSSSEVAAFAVEPGSEPTLSMMMRILRAKTEVSFAVKGGGHAMSPHFSSTTGVQIHMALFNKIRYDSEEKTLVVGAGCIWDDVYPKIAEHGRIVVGGAASDGVGVAGWLLGGGYSLRTNKYGLGIDNVVRYRVILPDGQLCVATENNAYKDLYQALRGGGNNFGIVTEFTLKTYPRPRPVSVSSESAAWGGALSIPGAAEEEVKDAIVAYVNHEKDPEAVIVCAFRHTLIDTEPNYKISVLCVYDAPMPPSFRVGPFQQFSEIMDKYSAQSAEAAPRGAEHVVAATGGGDVGPSWFGELSHETVNLLASFPYDFETELPMQSVWKRGPNDVSESASFAAIPPIRGPGPVPGPRDDQRDWAERLLKGARARSKQTGARGRFACIMVSKYTKKLVNAVADEAREAAKYLRERSGKLVLIDVWPFQACMFDTSPGGAAWPHNKGEPLGPLLAYFLWDKVEDDAFWVEKIKVALRNIEKVALAEGCTTRTAPQYSNTSLGDISPELVYRSNMAELSKVKAKYDPQDVMGQTGGFKIPVG